MLRKNWKYLFYRELSNYYNTPIAYVFLSVCLMMNYLFFFLGIFGLVPAFWDTKEASIRGYLNLIPITFLFLVPAVTMRLWSEERKNGTIELLRTLPLDELDMVVAKFAAAWVFVSILIYASLPLAMFTWIFGENFDWGSTIAMYVGATLMAGAYVSSGLVLSTLTREQVVAFVMIFIMGMFMFLSNYYVVSRHLNPDLARVIGFFSHSYHYNSFSRGLIRFSDVFYYTSFITLMLTINIWLLRKER